MLYRMIANLLVWCGITAAALYGYSYYGQKLIEVYDRVLYQLWANGVLEAMHML